MRELAQYHTIDLIAFNQRELMAHFYDSDEAALEDSGNVLRGICRNVELVPLTCDHTRYGKHILAMKSLFTKVPYTINWMKSDI